MIESYCLDITPYSLTLVEIMRKDALAKLLAGQGHPIKLRGMVNMLNYTYGLVFNYEKVNYPVTMRWGIYLNSKREATFLVVPAFLTQIRERAARRRPQTEDASRG